MRIAPSLALAALLLAPLAAAHVDSYAQSRALQAGPYLVFFEPRPTPPFANHTVSLVVQLSDGSTGTPIRGDVPVTILVGGPGGFNERKQAESDGTGYQIASMLLPERGNYSARVLIRDEATNETHAADAEFEVFPDLPFRIRPVDVALDVYTGQRTPIAFEVMDPITLERKDDAFPDLEVNVEHWSDDHSTFLGAEEATAEKTGVGVWRIDHVFKEPGMHHLRFASEAGGFNYADVPLLHVYAIPPSEGDLQQTPSLGTLGALAALVGAVALLRRR